MQLASVPKLLTCSVHAEPTHDICHGHVASHLSHPLFVRMRRDASDVDYAWIFALD